MDTVKYYSVGMLETNCVLIRHEENETLYIIDPGADGAFIADAADDFYSKRKHTCVLFTHAHVDHISGAGELSDRIKADYYFMPAPDADFYYSPLNNLEPYLPAASNLPAITSAVPADSDLEIIACPGHTPGSVAYYFKSLETLVSGDTLFRESIGRTDFPGGDYDAIQRSLSRLVKLIPPETRIIPGHGPETQMSHELSCNPYLS